MNRSSLVTEEVVQKQKKKNRRSSRKTLCNKRIQQDISLAREIRAERFSERLHQQKVLMNEAGANIKDIQSKILKMKRKPNRRDNQKLTLAITQFKVIANEYKNHQHLEKES